MAQQQSATVESAPRVPKPAPLAWPDRLRILATVMVIAIHVTSPTVEQFGTVEPGGWWAANWWNSLTRPAVPLFVMLSGYLLFAKDYPLSDFLRRRFSRVLIPSFFWMLVFSVYNYFANGHPRTVEELFRSLISGPVYFHLWFIYMIIGLYLVYPILRPWVRSASDREFLYFFICCAVGTWLWKILYVFFQLPIGISFELFCNQCGYFVLGYYLGWKPLVEDGNGQGDGQARDNGQARGLPLRAWAWSDNQLRWIAWGLIVGGTVVTAVGTWWVSTTKGGGHYFPYFQDYLTPNVGLASIGWFLLARLSFGKPALRRWEGSFAAASFGIYFAHVIVLDWWKGYVLKSVPWSPVVFVPVHLLLTVSCTFGFILLLRMLPGGKKIT